MHSSHTQMIAENDSMPWWLLDSHEANPMTKFLEQLEQENTFKEKLVITCKACDHKITTLENMAFIDDQSHHYFTNPSGIQFEIICFDIADGCTVSGKATDYFTWFPGYLWQFSYCSNCGDHLGWYYSHSENQAFFGLIAEKLKGV